MFLIAKPSEMKAFLFSATNTELIDLVSKIVAMLEYVFHKSLF